MAYTLAVFTGLGGWSGVVGLGADSGIPIPGWVGTCLPLSLALRHTRTLARLAMASTSV